MRYAVWGFSDEDPAREEVIEMFDTQAEAIAYAKQDGMSTGVVDTDTDYQVWSAYPTSDRVVSRGFGDV